MKEQAAATATPPPRSSGKQQQNGHTVPANLAKRLELLEQRFHSPFITTENGALSNQMSNADASNSHMSRHSHSIGFSSHNNIQEATGGESSSIVSGSNNAATRLMSNAKEKQSQNNNSNQGSMSSVSNPLPATPYSMTFLQVNRAAEMHIQKACKQPSSNGASEQYLDSTIGAPSSTIGAKKSKKRPISPDRHSNPTKKESSRKQSKPVKKTETTYSNSDSIVASKKKSRGSSSSQTTLELSNPPINLITSNPNPPVITNNEYTSNHASNQHRQPLPAHESSTSRDKSSSNHSSVRNTNSIPKKLTPKQRRIDSFMSSLKLKDRNTNDSTSTKSKQVMPMSPLNCGRKSPSTCTNSGLYQSSNIESELEQLRKRCQNLEQLCNDKEERLKAVANNQTIIHSSLKSELLRKDKEMEEINDKYSRKTETSMKAIEELIRADAIREAKDVREKLASDSARLGRVVYSRAGLRTLESWENGYALTSIKNRRSLLVKKKEVLEKRQKDLKKIVKQVQSKTVESPSEVNAIVTSDFTDISNCDIDIMASEESLRMHLTNMKKDEQKLLFEEEALEKEKIAHIRQLRRVANEDSSRFRGNLKLHDRYILYNLLGKGGFSEVWKGYDIVELRQVAVKIHQLDPRWSEGKKDNYTKHVSREYEIHRNVRHPRIVSLFDVFEIDSNSFATVLECCDGTDLDTVLKDQKSLTERNGRAILLQILSGMRYLSSPSQDGTRQGIIHYDLKPGNILFDEYGDAKITDFGLSKIVDTDSPEDSMELTSQGAGTYWYLPPECFITHESVRISNKVDVWSIGIIYYQMLYGRRPFGHGETQDTVLSNQTMLNAREVHFPAKPNITDDGKRFIKYCLTYDQALRPSISELCKDPYLVLKL